MTQTDTNSPNFRQAIARNIQRSTSAAGRIVLPAVKGAFEPYAQRLERLFSTLGKPFSPKELVQLCQNLSKTLDAATQAEGDSQLVIDYEPAPFPNHGLNYRLQTVAQQNPPQVLLTQGKIVLPCIPALCDSYLQQIARAFAVLTYPLNQEQGQKLREKLQQELDKGFLLSPHARVLVTYATAGEPQPALSCKVSVVSRSLADKAEDILRQNPDYLNKIAPPTKIADVCQTADPEAGPVLLAGIGTGQYALPLARQGFHVDAIDLAAPFAEKLQAIAAEENLAVSAKAADLVDPLVPLERDRYQLAVVSEIAPNLQNLDALKTLLEKLSAALIPGGRLLLNLFLSHDEVSFDRIALETARAENCTAFSRSQLQDLLAPLPLQLSEEVGVIDYEKQHRSQDLPKLDLAYAQWALGQHVFMMPQPPLALYWLTLTRDSSPAPVETSSEPQTQF